MKRKLIFGLFCFSLLLLSGCKKELVTTYYSIGCVGFMTSGSSDWAGLEQYMNHTVTYNKPVSFTNETAEENDNEAVNYFNTQAALLNADSTTSYIHGEYDYLIYGITKFHSIDDSTSTFNILKGVKLTSSGITDYVGLDY